MTHVSSWELVILNGHVPSATRKIIISYSLHSSMRFCHVTRYWNDCNQVTWFTWVIPINHSLTEIWSKFITSIWIQIWPVRSTSQKKTSPGCAAALLFLFHQGLSGRIFWERYFTAGKDISAPSASKSGQPMTLLMLMQKGLEQDCLY